MSSLKISIVIPFYNTPIELFIECLHSVKKLKPFEIILVDDCSSDLELIKTAKNSGCKYLKTPYQSDCDGVPFNIGVKESKGDYICRVDSDDILLELPVQMLTDIHFGNANRVAISKDLTVEELILAPRAILNAMVIKKEILLKHPLAEDANVFADVLLVLCLLHNKYSYSIHEKVNYIYRKRKNSIQTSRPDFHHRLRQMQTVSRFCFLENIEPKLSVHYLELAMLNAKYGANSRNVYRNNKLKIKKSSR